MIVGVHGFAVCVYDPDSMLLREIVLRIHQDVIVTVLKNKMRIIVPPSLCRMPATFLPSTSAKIDLARPDS
jgi:hypothetical protein